jgi:hypothetical protein
MQVSSIRALLVLALVACGGKSGYGSDAPDGQAGFSGAASATAGMTFGGIGGTAGAGAGRQGRGGSGGGDDPGVVGGFGPVGERGATKLWVGYGASSPKLTDTQVFFTAGDRQNGGTHWLLVTDKETGGTRRVAPFPQNGGEFVVTNERVLVSGSELQGEGPPSDRWIVAIDVATGAVSTTHTSPGQRVFGLVLWGSDLLFSLDDVLTRMPAAGGELEALAQVTDGSPFAAADGRVFLRMPQGFSAYDLGLRALVQLTEYADPLTGEKVRSDHLYFRSMTETPEVFGVPAAGGAVERVAGPSTASTLMIPTSTQRAAVTRHTVNPPSVGEWT